jgi:hypothetical protein
MTTLHSDPAELQEMPNPGRREPLEPRPAVAIRRPAVASFAEQEAAAGAPQIPTQRDEVTTAQEAGGGASHAPVATNQVFLCPDNARRKALVRC